MTTGAAVFLCDESILPAVEFQRNEFQKMYPEASVRLQTGSPGEICSRWFGKESACMMITCIPDSAGSSRIEESALAWNRHKVALDALAVIVNRRNDVRSLSVDQLKRILKGEIRTWKAFKMQEQPVTVQDRIQVLRESDDSGNTTFLKSLGLLFGDSALTVFFRPEPNRPSSAQILEHTASHRNALGFVSTAWLTGNPDYLSFCDLIRIVSISADDFSDAVEPVPGYIYRGDYPLRRIIYLYTHETGPDVSLGFASFLCGNEGQRIFPDLNLVPAVNPVRLKFEGDGRNAE